MTTGTGSGKSLTYLVPIFDAIIRNAPERHSVRAILVYPMNALINSQLDALRDFQEENFPDSPIRFDRYTGQEREEDRERILNDRPHILLTNYVMAEYILVRPSERPLLSAATRDLRTLVMDELHFYRGRQGADVAMLTRRLQESAGRDLQAIATSATMVTGGSRTDRKESVADLASRFFGLDIKANNVVDETLRRVALAPVPRGADEIRISVESDPPDANAESVCRHPLAAWAEEAFGISNEDGRLIRRSPETFEAVVQRLADESGLSTGQCAIRLREVLEAGNEAMLEDGNPVFAFRLHQWLSSGNSVYATLEPPDTREFRMEGQYRADKKRVLYPLAFCRECGQEYYLVSRNRRTRRRDVCVRARRWSEMSRRMLREKTASSLWSRTIFGKETMTSFLSIGSTSASLEESLSRTTLNTAQGSIPQTQTGVWKNLGRLVLGDGISHGRFSSAFDAVQSMTEERATIENCRL